MNIFTFIFQVRFRFCSPKLCKVGPISVSFLTGFLVHHLVRLGLTFTSKTSDTVGRQFLMLCLQIPGLKKVFFQTLFWAKHF